MEKASFVMRPESFVSLSEITSRYGLTRALEARPGMAANASFASPSIAAPSLMVQIVTRSRLATLSAMASPCDCGNAEPSGPLLSNTPSGFKCDSP